MTGRSVSPEVMRQSLRLRGVPAEDVDVEEALKAIVTEADPKDDAGEDEDADDEEADAPPPKRPKVDGEADGAGEGADDVRGADGGVVQDMDAVATGARVADAAIEAVDISVASAPAVASEANTTADGPVAIGGATVEGAVSAAAQVSGDWWRLCCLSHLVVCSLTLPPSPSPQGCADGGSERRRCRCHCRCCGSHLTSRIARRYRHGGQWGGSRDGHSRGGVGRGAIAFAHAPAGGHRV